MKLIADGGSTKTDWALLDNTFSEPARFKSKGLNPALLTTEQLFKRLHECNELVKWKNKVEEVHFFGAGCGTTSAQKKLHRVFKHFFTNVKIIEVEEDMLGAVYATSGGKEAIVGILGTGANSCYFDGKKMYRNVVSLGYILMDEGSANHIGKKLILDYYYQQMPPGIARQFSKEHNMDPDYLKYRLYQSESPNVYLGEVGGFAVKHKNSGYIRKLVTSCLDEFFLKRILPYPKRKEIPLYFVGSIAWFFEDILSELSEKKYQTRLSGIVRQPIEGLIAYLNNG